MKSLYILVLALILLHPLNSFSQDEKDSTTTIKFSERIPPDLEIEVKVKENGAIGYANCFQGQVIKVVRGILPDTAIFITVLAGDDENYDILSKAGKDEVFKLFLVFNKANEKYSTTYITGFVDSDNNSWRIIEIQKP